MYVSPAAIQSLMDRMGFKQPVQPTAIVLNADVVESIIGRTFDSFHPYCTVENIEMCMPISNATVAPEQTVNNAHLNAYLLDLKRQAVLASLDKVFNTVAASVTVNCAGKQTENTNTDYTALVMRRGSTLDCVIGYQMALMVLEMMQNTSRSNARQRTAIDTMSIIQAMQGVVMTDGRRLSPGVEQKLQTCIDGVIGQLFPNATNNGRPTIRAINWS